jgi:hypothetical protein
MHASIMGWRFLDSDQQTLRIEYRQGSLIHKLVRKGRRFVVRYLRSDGRAVATLGFDEEGAWARGADGRPLQIANELLDEFVVTSKILSNDFRSFTQIAYSGAKITHPWIEPSTLVMNTSVSVDLFMWRNGHLAGTLLRFGNRAVRLMPAGRMEVAPGRWLYSRWLRDREDLIEVSRAQVGAKIYDAELSRDV